MAENEMKVRSIRLNDETFKKLKEITSAAGGNQQDAIQLMVNAYYMQEQKAALPDCKASLDEFEGYATALISMYTQALQSQQDTRRAVMQEFDAQLKSKDAIIMQMQDKLNAAKQASEEAIARVKQTTDDNKQLADTITGLQTALTDKDEKNQILSNLCNNLQSQVNAMQEAAAQTDVLQEQIKHLEKERDKAIRQYTALQEQMKQVQQQAQLAMDKALLDADRAHQEQLQQTINEYQSQYLQLLKQLHSQAIPSSSDDTQGGQ